MGGGRSKDKYIDIYLEIGNQYYQAGAAVRGTVHLNVNADVNYDVLYLRLQGTEEVEWYEQRSTGNGTYTERFHDRRDIYADEFILEKFGGTIGAGHYSHPFQLTLPPNLPGSNYVDSSNYLKYELVAYVVNFTTKKKAQFEQVLTIIENPKQSMGPYNFSDTRNPKCCGCCANYGPTKINVKMSSNVISPGQIVKIQVQVDNRMSKKQIGNVVIKLNQYYVRYARQVKEQQQETFLTYNWELKNKNKVIKPGQTELIEMDYPVSNKIIKGVSGGQISAIFYAFEIDCDQGSCSYQNCARAMIYVFPKTPAVHGYIKTDPPKNWSPKISALVVYPAMKPYLHQPCGAIVQYYIAYQNSKVTNYEFGVKPSFDQQRPMNYMKPQSADNFY